MFLKNGLCLNHCCVRSSSDQVFLGHYFVDKTIIIFLKAQIAVRNDTNEVFSFIDHGNTADLKFSHHSLCIRDCRILQKGNRI